MSGRFPALPRPEIVPVRSTAISKGLARHRARVFLSVSPSAKLNSSSRDWPLALLDRAAPSLTPPSLPKFSRNADPCPRPPNDELTLAVFPIPSGPFSARQRSVFPYRSRAGLISPGTDDSGTTKGSERSGYVSRHRSSFNDVNAAVCGIAPKWCLVQKGQFSINPAF